MQYILSADEYAALKNEPNRVAAALNVVIMDLCTQVADHKLVTSVDGSTNKVLPWGCIQTGKPAMGHCGGCPVEKQCPSNRKYFCK